MIYRVAEVTAIGVGMSRAMGWDSDDHAGFAFRWTALEGRRVQGWANPLRSIGLRSAASARRRSRVRRGDPRHPAASDRAARGESGGAAFRHLRRLRGQGAGY
jgi:hypothetical protein